jgi:hypothetical protein
MRRYTISMGDITDASMDENQEGVPQPQASQNSEPSDDGFAQFMSEGGIKLPAKEAPQAPANNSSALQHSGGGAETSMEVFLPAADDAGSVSLVGDEGPRETKLQRSFFSLDAITHVGIGASPCNKLFHRAWQEGLHFDVDQRTGVVFNLSEKYISGRWLLPFSHPS